MKLGILRTDTVRKELSAQFGEYPDMFQKLFHAVDPTLEIVAYNVQEGEYPVEIDEVDAYLITGSSSSVYEDKDWIYKLGEFIKQLHARKKKTIGICFGHQLVAEVLGGKTEKAHSGWHIGNSNHEFKATDMEFPTSKSLNLIFSHQDQVTQPVPGSKILASTSKCPFAICTIENHLLTIQGHPEFEVDYARQLIATRKHIFEEEIYDSAIRSLSLPNNRAEAAQMMLDFLNA